MHYSYRYIRYTIQSYSIAHIGMKEIYSCAKLKVKHLHWWKKKKCEFIRCLFVRKHEIFQSYIFRKRSLEITRIFDILYLYETQSFCEKKSA